MDDMENLGSIEDDQATPEQASSQPLVIVDRTGHEWEFPAGTDVEKAKAYVSSRVPPAEVKPAARLGSAKTGGSIPASTDTAMEGSLEAGLKGAKEGFLTSINPMTYVRMAREAYNHPVDAAVSVATAPIRVAGGLITNPAETVGNLAGGMLAAKAVPVATPPAARATARVTGRALTTLGEHPWSMRAAGVAAGVGHSGGLGIAIAAAPEYLVKIGTALERWGTKPGALAELPLNKQLEVREMIRDARDKLTPDTPNFPEIKAKLDALDDELKAARADARLAPELKDVEKGRTRLDALDRKRRQLEKEAGTPEVSDEEAINKFWGGKKPAPAPPGTIRVATPGRDAVDAMMESRPSATPTVAGEAGLSAEDAQMLRDIEAANARRGQTPAAPTTPPEQTTAEALQRTIRKSPAETPVKTPAASTITESVFKADELQSLSKATGIKAEGLAGYSEKQILDLLRYTKSKFPERLKANPDAAAILKRLEDAGKPATAPAAAPAGEKPIRTTAPEPPLAASRSKGTSDVPGVSVNDLSALAEFVQQNPGVSGPEIVREILRQRADRNAFYKKYGKVAERLDKMADEATARDRR